METNIKYVNIPDRTEFQKLMSYLARAIDTKFLHDPDIVPVILIGGDSGKSLGAESMIKSWSDEFKPAQAVTIPKDDKMFLEQTPAQACQTVSIKTPVAGKTAKLAFNSDVIESREHLDKELVKAFGDASANGVMIFSNPAIMHRRDFFSEYDNEKAPIFLSVRVQQPWAPGKPDDFKRTLDIRVHDERLMNDTRFLTYWNNIENFSRSGGLNAIRAPEKPPRAVPPLPPRIS